MSASQAEIAIIIKAQNEAATALASANAGVLKLGESAGTIGSKLASVGASLAGLAAGAAVAGLAAVGAGFAAATSTAASFEAEMSAIKAVSGATGAEMEALQGKALQLGADTSFSAREAASGIEELLKAGVSVADVMGGGAAAALNLAAAGGVSVSEAATIASDAMNMFGLKGADAAHVADLLAGASVASSADVHGLGQGLAAVGAVAHVVGLDINDTTTALALMAQSGVKGSDAGTSLKTMLLNLTPSTKAQIAVAKELGIVTKDGANQFFDASGKAKSMSDIAGVLQTATKGLTEQQKLQTLATLFGTDAIRAAAIMAEAGATGFDKMAEAESKIGADEVAKTRLDNLTGAMGQLGGSVETVAIKMGLAFTPVIRQLVDSLTTMVNDAGPLMEAFASAISEGLAAGIVKAKDIFRQLTDAWRTVQQVFAGDWSPDGSIEPIARAAGNAATKLKELRDAVQQAIDKASQMGAWQNLERGLDKLRETANNIPTRLDEIADALSRLNGASGGTTTKIDAMGTALKIVSVGFELWSLHMSTLVDTTLLAGKTVVNWLTILSSAGTAVKALATGDMPAFGEAVRRGGDALADMVVDTAKWQQGVESNVRQGARAIGLNISEQTALAQAIGAANMEKLAQAVDTEMAAANQAVGTNSAGMVRFLEENGAGMAAAAQAGADGVLAATQTGMTNAAGAVQAAGPEFGAAATAAGTAAADGITATAPAMAAAAELGASSAVAAVQAQEGPAGAAGSSVGDSIGSGMQTGILGWLGSVAAAGARLASAAIEAARGPDGADAHSPSRKMQELGKDMVAGLEGELSKANVGAPIVASLKDMLAAAREYIPVAGEIARVQDEIKSKQQEAQTSALFRAKEMITLDSETLRLKQAAVILERDILPLRQEIARYSRDIAEAERGSLDTQRQLIEFSKTSANQNIRVNELEKEKIPLRAQELEIERMLLGLDPSSKRAKDLKAEQDELRKKSGLIDNTISQIRLQTRAQELDADTIKNGQTVATAAARIRKAELEWEAVGQGKVIDAIKDQIGVLGAEKTVFEANEAIIKGATQNEIDYRNRLIAVFTAEGKPLADRIAAGLKLLDQLHNEGKISDELYNAIKKTAEATGDASTATRALGTASAVATPQLDAAAKKAEEMAKQAKELAENTNGASDEINDLAKSLGKLPDWFTATGSKGGSSLSSLFGGGKANGGPVSAGTAYLVGERGPEMFMPGRSGSIVPIAVASFGGGGGFSGRSPMQYHEHSIKVGDVEAMRLYVVGRDLSVRVRGEN